MEGTAHFADQVLARCRLLLGLLGFDSVLFQTAIPLPNDSLDLEVRMLVGAMWGGTLKKGGLELTSPNLRVFLALPMFYTNGK